MSNGQDLDGEYAFDKVLEAFSESVRKGAEDHAMVQSLRRDVTDTTNAASLVTAEVLRLRKFIDDHETKVVPLLQELQSAASNLLLRLTQTLGDAGMASPQLDEPRKRLSQAITAAQPHCGIPF